MIEIVCNIILITFIIMALLLLIVLPRIIIININEE